MASTDPRYKEARRTEAAHLYLDEHLSIREVAKRMDVSVKRAWDYLEDAGVDRRPVGRPRKDEQVQA